MEIKPGLMVHLGYGRYWRSDEIVGLLPIEDRRGPGRRTEVYVATQDSPIVASRSEQSILQDMAALPDEAVRAAESRSLVGDLLEEIRDLSPVLRRMLRNEGGIDVEFWIRRLEQLASPELASPSQEDLFPKE